MFRSTSSSVRALLVLPFLHACTSAPEAVPTEASNAGAPIYTHVMDPHSFSRPNEIAITHLDLDIRVDMEKQRIEGTASYRIDHVSGDTIILDTDGLEIKGVSLDAGKETGYVLGDATPFGRALRIHVPKGTERVNILYSTGADAKALLWVPASQTTDKQKPLLFTQGQAILTRSWVPVQDSPGIRITYDAKVHVPSDLMAVMSAVNPQQRSADGVYTFKMENPIPPYLMALAVGDLAFKSVGGRTGVYAEKSVVDTAAWELADMENMLKAAEALYGPYRWGRYDVLVLPGSFPYGGMENPCLTFATPTILAGDRSLTALIAHELAHSWSGNLVTNATWDDFWLNEGFTVYFEKRICEQVYGADYSEMLATLGYQDLLLTVADIDSSAHPEDTHLKLNLAGRDPDEGMSDIAYEKGYSFLRMLEAKVGRAKFDPFLRTYFDSHAFQSMTTEGFLAYLKKELLEPNGVTVNLDEWVYQSGLPTDLIVPHSARFAAVEGEVKKWEGGAKAADLGSAGWSAFEWMHFVRHLPEPMDKQHMAELDAAFHFSQSHNTEVLAAWLEQCVRNDYAPAYPVLDVFLHQVGRRKFLRPLYTGLMATEKGRVIALGIYKTARRNYHSVSVHTIDEIVGWQPVAGHVTL